MKKPIKKRNKKYNGNAIRIQKTHLMQMSWEEVSVQLSNDMYCLNHGVNEDNPQPTPLNIWLSSHKGDLAIALKTKTIPPMLSFHAVSRIHAVNNSTGEEFKCDYQLATPQLMTIWDFLGVDIESRSPIYIEEKGIKTRWKGFYAELNKYFEDAIADNGGNPDDFEIKTNHIVMTTLTSFKSFAHERHFKSVKLVNLGNGLGVAA